MVFAVHSDEGTETAAAQTIVKCAAMPQKNQSIRKIQHSCAEEKNRYLPLASTEPKGKTIHVWLSAGFLGGKNAFADLICIFA